MSFLEEQLQKRTQDAIIWKSKYIWKCATNPDKTVDAYNQLAIMFLAIPNDVKRDNYINRVTEDVNKLVREKENLIADLEKQIKKTQTDISKLKNKKKTTDDDITMLDSLPKKLIHLESTLLTARSDNASKLDQKALIKLIKDERERKRISEEKKQRKAEMGDAGEQLKESIGLWSDFDGDVILAKQYGICVYKNRYHALKGPDTWVEISNFTMRIIYHVQTSNEVAYRLIAIKNVYGYEVVINMVTDDMVTVSSFRKVIQRRGHFIFSGNDAQLCCLSDMLQKEEQPTSFVEYLGYQPRAKLFAWANGVSDFHPESTQQFIAADEYGIVDIREKKYFIPAMSKMFAERDGDFVNEKKFVYVSNSNIDFRTWSRLHRKAYGDKAVIAQLWFLSALFRDIIFSDNTIRATPILNLTGERGSGKTSFADSLMCLFGFSQPPIPLGAASTVKGFMRSFGQFSNAIVYLEEYKNSVKKEYIEALKNVYDGTSYRRAQRTNDLQTDTIPVRSACLLAGQEMPTIEDALFQRVIMLVFKPGLFSSGQKEAFTKLRDSELHGLSSIVGEVGMKRTVVLENFRRAFDAAKPVIYAATNNPAIHDRYIMNISIMQALREVLGDELAFDYSPEESRNILIANMKQQFMVSQGNDDLGKFWMIIEQCVAMKTLVPGRDFRHNGGEVWFYMPTTYPAYVKEMGIRRDPNCLDKPTLENYLKNDVAVYVGYQKIKIDTRNAQSHWCLGFNLSVLSDRYKIELVAYQQHEPLNQSPITTTQITSLANNDWNSGAPF